VGARVGPGVGPGVGARVGARVVGAGVGARAGARVVGVGVGPGLHFPVRKKLLNRSQIANPLCDNAPCSGWGWWELDW
jgi:hypothetical protein